MEVRLLKSRFKSSPQCFATFCKTGSMKGVMLCVWGICLQKGVNVFGVVGVKLSLNDSGRCECLHAFAIQECVF